MHKVMLACPPHCLVIYTKSAPGLRFASQGAVPSWGDSLDSRDKVAPSVRFGVAMRPRRRMAGKETKEGTGAMVMARCGAGIYRLVSPELAARGGGRGGGRCQLMLRPDDPH